ncbi:MAG: translation initiation factor IF-2 N-terminal domain-containing protein, partial [Acidimicrobiales bacterium]
MPKKIRVYELAHELGLTNKEALDLCLSLGMGVKSHSSSIEDAQADRARRKADREGLRRPVQPEEPAAPAKATKKAAAKKVAATTETPAPAPAAPVGETPPASTPATVGTATDLPEDRGGSSTPVKRSGGRLVTSRPSSEQPASTGPALVRSGPAAAPTAPAAPRPAPTPAPAPRPAQR